MYAGSRLRRTSRNNCNAFLTDRRFLCAGTREAGCGRARANRELAGRGERPWLHAVFRARADQPGDRGAAQAGVDFSHGRTRRAHGQDDRVHAAGGRWRDVCDHRVSARGGSGRDDRERDLAVRSLARPSVCPSASIGGREPRLCFLVGSNARRRAADHSWHVGRTIVLARRKDRQAGREVRRRGRLQPAGWARAQSGGARRRAHVGPCPLERHDLRRRFVWRGAGIAAPGDIRAFDVRTGKEVWRFRTVPGRGNSGTRRGKAIRGMGAVRSMPGAVSASTPVAGWSSPGWDRPRSIFMAATGTGIISSRTARSRSTRGPASVSGTFRRCDMTSGTMTCRFTRTWSRSLGRASPSTQSRR